MKRFTSLCLAALVLSACQKTGPVSDVEMVSTTIYAHIADESTSVSIPDSGTPSWQSGDQIALYDGSEFQTFSLSDPATGAFTGPAGTYTLAVYPAGIAGSVNQDGELTLNLPNSYTWADGCTFAPMIATRSASGEPFAFYALTGLFKYSFINIPDEATTLHFSSTNLKICGEFNVGVPAPGTSVIELGNAESDAEKNISVSIPSGHASTMTFYLPVPAGGEGDTFSVSISQSDGIPSAEKAASQAYSVNRAAMRRFKSIDCSEALPAKIYLIGDCLDNSWSFSDSHVLTKGQGGVYTGHERIGTGGFKTYMNNDWGATWLSIDEANSSKGNLIPYGGEAYKAREGVGDTQVYPTGLGYDAGVYDIELDLINKTMTLTWSDDQGGEDEDTWLERYYLSGDIFDENWGWPSLGTPGLILEKQSVGIYTCTAYLYLDHSNRSFKFWESTDWGGEHKFSGTYNSADQSFGIVKAGGDPAFKPYDYGYQSSGTYEIKVDFKQMKVFLTPRQ